MLDSVRDMAYSVKERVKETVVSYTSKSEIDKILIEATSNENWNIANSKLQVLADASNNYEYHKSIMTHLFQKLESPAFEWRRILKSLTTMEYLLKHGPPRIQQDLRNEMFKITTLQQFTYYEDNIDKGAAIRDKAILITDLLSQPHRLEEEREAARQYREKFYTSSGGGYSGGSTQSYGGGTPTVYGGGQPYGGGSQSYGGGTQSYGSHGYGGGIGSNEGHNNQSQSGVLSKVAQGAGDIAYGVGSVVTSGIGYISSWKSGNKPDPQLSGFYDHGQTHGAYGGQNYYNPPGVGVSSSSGNDTLQKPNTGRWGPPTTTQQQPQVPAEPQRHYKPLTDVHPMSSSTPKSSEQIQPSSTLSKNDQKLFSGVDKSEKKKKKKKRKHKKSESSSSESSSEDEAPPKSKTQEQKQQPKEEINLLEWDTPAAPVSTTTTAQATGGLSAFDFLSSSTSQPQQQHQTPQPQSNNLLDLLDISATPSSFQPMTPTPMNPLQQLQQQLSLSTPAQPQNPSVSLFQNMNVNQKQTSETNPPAQPPVQQQQQPVQQKKEEPVDNGDAWSMGKGLVNLNLKASMGLESDAPSFLQKNESQNTQASNVPLYMRPDANPQQKGGFQPMINFQNPNNQGKYTINHQSLLLGLLGQQMFQQINANYQGMPGMTQPIPQQQVLIQTQSSSFTFLQQQHPQPSTTNQQPNSNMFM